jgi:hypothetical protein
MKARHLISLIFLLFLFYSCGNSPEHKNGKADTTYNLKKDSAGR